MSHPASEAKTAARPASVSLFVEAFCTNSWADSPAWAQIRLNDDFVWRLNRLHSICKEHNLAHVAIYHYVQAWDHEDELRLTEDKLVVTNQEFWFEANPKHEDGVIETFALTIEHTMKAWQAIQAQNGDGLSDNEGRQALKAAGLSDDTWAYVQGRLFYSAKSKVQELIEQVLDGGNEEETDQQDGSQPSA